MRWGIVSAGLIATDFCLALRTLSADEHQIVAVAARSLERAKQFAETHGIRSAYGSYESLAQDPDVDVVYIATLNPTHVSLSLMMLTAGKHVVCEKPMSLTVAGAKKVLDFAHQKQLFYTEGLWSRFFPAYEQLRQELSSGSIGDVKGLTVYFGVAFDRIKHARVFEMELGGGVMKDIGVYLVQLACLVFHNEKPEKICVNGVLLDSGTDLSADVMLCYKDGRTANLIARGDCTLPNNAVIFGTKGIIEIAPPFFCPTLLKTPSQDYRYELPKTPEPTVYQNSAGFVHEISAVRSAILQGELKVPQITHADSLFISELTDEILRQIGVKYDAE